MCVQGRGEILPGVFGQQEDQRAWGGESQSGNAAVDEVRDGGLASHVRVLSFILRVTGAIVGFAAEK